MDPTQQIVASLRQEILQHGSQQLTIALFTIGAALLLVVLCRSGACARVAPVIPLILISGTFAIGRSDLLMHRAGAYIAQLESGPAMDNPGGWETFKTSHRATKWVPVYDVLSALILFWLFIDGQHLAWGSLPHAWRLPFAILTTCLLAVALASIPFAVWLTRPPHP